MKQQKDIISILIKIAFAVIFFFIWGILIFYPNKLSPQFIIPNGCIFFSDIIRHYSKHEMASAKK